jgi:hypothetical protein
MGIVIHWMKIPNRQGKFPLHLGKCPRNLDYSDINRIKSKDLRL